MLIRVNRRVARLNYTILFSNLKKQAALAGDAEGIQKDAETEGEEHDIQPGRVQQVIEPENIIHQDRTHAFENMRRWQAERHRLKP